MRWLLAVCILVLTLSPCGFLRAQKEIPSQSKTWRRIQQRGFITVSLDPDNLPYSAREGELRGIEVELAHAVAQQLGLAAKIDWIHVRSETSLARLLDRDSDVVMGLPVEKRLRHDDELVAERIAYTRPYYRTGYLIYVRTGGPRVERLSDLQGEQTRRVGAQAGTLADAWLKRHGFRCRLYGTQQAALTALAEKQIDYAYLWSNASWLARSSPELGVEIVQPYELADGRQMAAVVRRGDEDFRERLNGALDRLVDDAFVERLLKRYGMPYYPPHSDDESISSNRQNIERRHFINLSMINATAALYPFNRAVGDDARIAEPLTDVLAACFPSKNLSMNRFDNWRLAIGRLAVVMFTDYVGCSFGLLLIKTAPEATAADLRSSIGVE